MFRLLFSLALFFSIFSNAFAQSTPPNIVLIISDDQAWTDFGFMGHPDIQTPYLDKLAAQSALFPRGYVPSSLCRPSLATMITGLYPHQHGITGNDPPRGTDRNLMLKHIRREQTLPNLLAKKGYVSFQTGKWWEGNHKLGGFTDGMTHGDTTRGGRHGDLGLKIGRKGMKPIFDFLENHRRKPFFLWYAPFLPHTPHNPPERILKKYRRANRSIRLAKYYAMCEWFDETCGELLNYLDKKKLSQNTLVVFIVDNGWIQRTNKTKIPKRWRFGFAPRSKRSPYDGGIRTPIMLRWPGGKVKPGKFDTPVSSIDLAPTILAAAKLNKVPKMQGIDLLSVAKNGGKTQRDTIFGDIYAHDVADIDEPAKSLQYRWCIQKKWKLILPSSKNEKPKLYDLFADPHEKRDLATRHPERVTKLRLRIASWWSLYRRKDR